MIVEKNSVKDNREIEYNNSLDSVGLISYKNPCDLDNAIPQSKRLNDLNKKDINEENSLLNLKEKEKGKIENNFKDKKNSNDNINNVKEKDKDKDDIIKEIEIHTDKKCHFCGDSNNLDLNKCIIF